MTTVILLSSFCKAKVTRVSPYRFGATGSKHGDEHLVSWEGTTALAVQSLSRQPPSIPPGKKIRPAWLTVTGAQEWLKQSAEKILLTVVVFHQTLMICTLNHNKSYIIYLWCDKVCLIDDWLVIGTFSFSCPNNKTKHPKMPRLPLPRPSGLCWQGDHQAVTMSLDQAV